MDTITPKFRCEGWCDMVRECSIKTVTKDRKVWRIKTCKNCGWNTIEEVVVYDTERGGV